MAGVVKERIRDWIKRRFLPGPGYVQIYECVDVVQLLETGARDYGLASREGMLFCCRDQPLPAPRKEIVILTSVLASYSPERIIKCLESDLAPNSRGSLGPASAG